MKPDYNSYFYIRFGGWVTYQNDEIISTGTKHLIILGKGRNPWYLKLLRKLGFNIPNREHQYRVKPFRCSK